MNHDKLSSDRIAGVRFGLRTLLVAVTALAILFAQYPWFEYFAFEQGPIWTIDASAGTQYDAAKSRWISGVYFPTDGFIWVAAAEAAVAIIWCLNNRRARRRIAKFL